MRHVRCMLLGLFAACFACVDARAQWSSLTVGTADAVVDEYGSMLKGVVEAAETCGHTFAPSELVFILRTANGVIDVPGTNGMPTNSNNEIIFTTGIGKGIDVCLGQTGQFGASIPKYPVGQIFARVFNRDALPSASFYADSQVFNVNPNFPDPFIAHIDQTSNPLDPSDPDGDGLNNSWEKSVGSNGADPDTDGDGVSDGNEFRAGTGITNALSYLALVQLFPQSAGDLMVQWDSVDGKDYQLQFTANDLASTNVVFTNINGVVSATGPLASTIVTNGLSFPIGHFRVLLVE